MGENACGLNNFIPNFLNHVKSSKKKWIIKQELLDLIESGEEYDNQDVIDQLVNTSHAIDEEGNRWSLKMLFCELYEVP